MKVIKKEKFINIYIDNKDYIDFDFIDCSFKSVGLDRKISFIKDKVKFENISLKMCYFDIASIPPIDFVNLTLDGGEIRKSLKFCNSSFEECNFKGELGSVWIMDTASLTSSDSNLDREIKEYNKSKYESIKYALDISEADFLEFDNFGVPAENIKINNHNQFKVNYEKVSQDCHPSEFKSVLDIYLQKGQKNRYNFVIVNSKRNEFYDEDQKMIDYLDTNGYLI